MVDKITITSDDVNSANVDRKIQQQTAGQRAAEHYLQQVGSQMPSVTGTSGDSFLYNALFYMTFFGLIGGFLAWPPSEITRAAMEWESNEAQDFVVAVNELEFTAIAGEISGEEYELRSSELIEKYEENRFVSILIDPDLTDAQKEEKLAPISEEWNNISFISTLLFCACGGMLIAVCLSIADSLMGRNYREAVINGCVGMCLGMIGGLLVGTFINEIYHALGGGSSENIILQIFARAAGWAVLGLFLSIAPGIVIGSPKKAFIGLAGGFAGGLIGGGCFDVIAMITGSGWASRMVGLSAIGAVAGLSTGLIENVAKTGWLKVSQGLIAGKQFILYKNPTYLGSSPQCEIYLFKDPEVAPKHAAIRRQPNGYELQDLGTQTGTLVNGFQVKRTRLRNNDQIQIGGTVFLFREKSKS